MGGAWKGSRRTTMMMGERVRWGNWMNERMGKCVKLGMALILLCKSGLDNEKGLLVFE